MISRESKVSARHLNVRDNVAHNNYGAGICNQGKLSLFRSNVSHNRSTDTRPGEGQEFVGGGIYNVGYLELYSSSVMNNSAMQGGGIYTSTVGINTFDGLGGKLIVQSSTIAQNDALYGGAGIFSDYGEAMIAFSTLSDNVSKRPTVSSSKPSEYGALAIKGSDDFFNANYQPSYNAGQTAFVQGCVSCHATRPINSSNYTYESMSAKIYNTMKSLAPSCNAQCSQDIAHYLVHSGGEGSNDSIFGEMPSVLVYGNIIAGNYEDSTSSWPWSYNCNSIDDESFAEGSGYNTWGRDESTCNNAYSSTDSFLGFSRERPSKLQMEYTRLDHANAALMQMYWPDAWGLWSLYAPASDVRVAMPDWDIWHYFNNTVPTDCAPGVNCTVNRVIDGALKIKSVEGPFTPGAFQFE